MKEYWAESDIEFGPTIQTKLHVLLDCLIKFNVPNPLHSQ